jgi:hypothetical protein
MVSVYTHYSPLTTHHSQEFLNCLYSPLGDRGKKLKIMAVSGSKKWIITATVILCSILELIDTSIVNVVTNEIMAKSWRNDERSKLGDLCI